MSTIEERVSALESIEADRRKSRDEWFMDELDRRHREMYARFSGATYQEPAPTKAYVAGLLERARIEADGKSAEWTKSAGWAQYYADAVMPALAAAREENAKLRGLRCNEIVGDDEDGNAIRCGEVVRTRKVPHKGIYTYCVACELRTQLDRMEDERDAARASSRDAWKALGDVFNAVCPEKTYRVDPATDAQRIIDAVGKLRERSGALDVEACAKEIAAATLQGAGFDLFDLRANRIAAIIQRHLRPAALHFYADNPMGPPWTVKQPDPESSGGQLTAAPQKATEAETLTGEQLHNHLVKHDIWSSCWGQCGEAFKRRMDKAAAELAEMKLEHAS